MLNLNVLFWNIDGHKKNHDYKLAIRALLKLTRDKQFDVIMLAECEDELIRRKIEKRLKHLNPVYKNQSVAGSKVMVIHKLKKGQNKITKIQVKDEPRYSYMVINNLLLVGVHLLARGQGTTSKDLYKEAEYIKRKIVDLGASKKTDGIIIAGDFNLDPFEEGMISKEGFNASFSKDVAGRKPIKRTYGITTYKHPYFYNPSWHLHGNIHNKSQGTFYKNDSENRVFYHMLDQVIMSKKLIEHFNQASFKIVTEYKFSGKEFSLIGKGGRPEKKYSDHLPIRFKISEKVVKKWKIKRR